MSSQMLSERLESWLERRSRLHHDWFCNRLLTFVQAHWQAMDDPVRMADGAYRGFCQANLQVWEEKSRLLRQWNEEAVEVFHPGQYLADTGFSYLDRRSLDWLRQVLDYWYQAASGVVQRSKQIDTLWCRVDQGVRALREEGGGENSAQELYQNMLAMSQEISAYPTRVMLP